MLASLRERQQLCLVGQRRCADRPLAGAGNVSGLVPARTCGSMSPRHEIGCMDEALCYKPEGPSFDYRRSRRIIRLNESFEPHWVLWPTWPITETNTRIFLGVKRGRRGRLKYSPSSVDRLSRKYVYIFCITNWSGADSSKSCNRHWDTTVRRYLNTT